jgi:pimeloyl-ACP methyl ester carboxylesterase
MIDYVLDLAALLKTLDLFPITIIAHSLGARVALQYAGLYPDRMAKLVAIEGLGPPQGLTKPPSAVARMLQWVREMQALAGGIRSRTVRSTKPSPGMREPTPT